MTFSWAGVFPAVINCGEGDNIEILDSTMQYNIRDTVFDFFHYILDSWNLYFENLF